MTPRTPSSIPAFTSPPPDTDRLALSSVVLTWTAAAAVCAPFLVSAAPVATLGAVIPVAQWIPTLVVVGVSLWTRYPARSGIGLVDLLGMRTSGRALVAGAALAAMVIGGVTAAHLALITSLGWVEWTQPSSWLSTARLVPVVAVATTLAATGEELLWRGGLHTLLSRRGFWATAVLVSIAWGIFHVPLLVAYVATGEMDGRDVAASLLNLMAASMVLSALRQRTGSVWPAALGHGLLNSLVVFAFGSLTTPLPGLDDTTFWLVTASGWAVWILAARIVVARPRRAVHLEAPCPPPARPSLRTDAEE